MRFLICGISPMCGENAKVQANIGDKGRRWGSGEKGKLYINLSDGGRMCKGGGVKLGRFGEKGIYCSDGQRRRKAGKMG